MAELVETTSQSLFMCVGRSLFMHVSKPFYVCIKNPFLSMRPMLSPMLPPSREQADSTEAEKPMSASLLPQAEPGTMGSQKPNPSSSLRHDL